jgi:hypothetical protein
LNPNKPHNLLSLSPFLTIQKEGVSNTIVIIVAIASPDDTDGSRRGVIETTVGVRAGKKGSEAEDETGDPDKKARENQNR